MITGTDLKKRFGRRPVLEGMTLDGRPGDVTLLVGSNGAGKTTTLRILAGTLRPEGGSVMIDGHDLGREPRAARKSLSFLPQGVAFHPRLTCRQTLNFYARVRRVDRDRADAQLTRWGLDSHADEPTGTLSGGLRQRLGLAVLMLPDAPVLLLDEPGLSLDPEWRRAMYAMLQEEARRGKTVLVATHLLGEWENRATRVLLCAEGRVSGEADPAELQSLFDTPTQYPRGVRQVS